MKFGAVILNVCVESLINMNLDAGFLRGSLAVFSLGLSPYILSVTCKNLVNNEKKFGFEFTKDNNRQVLLWSHGSGDPYFNSTANEKVLDNKQSIHISLHVLIFLAKDDLVL